VFRAFLSSSGVREVRAGFRRSASQEVLDQDFASYSHEHYSADNGHDFPKEQSDLPSQDNAHERKKERHASDNHNGGRDVDVDERKTDAHNKGIDAGGQCHAAEHACGALF